jgi:hypothetical protein
VISSRTSRMLLAGAALSMLVAQGAASAADPLRLTKPVQATKEDQNPGRLYLAPALAVDPDNDLNVVAAFTEMRTNRCGLMRSTNGGETWRKLDASPSTPSYPFCLSQNRGEFQGQIAFGRGGTLYYALPGWDAQDGGNRGNNSLLVGRSTNLGDSWQTVVARDNRGKQGDDQEWIRPVGSIAVDSRSSNQDVVYVGYATNRRAASPNAAPREPSVVVSTDGGRTFAPPVNLATTVFGDANLRRQALSAVTTTSATGSTTTTTTPPPGSRAANPDQAVNFGGFQTVVTVDDKGTVWAAWGSNTANISPSPPSAIFVSRSTDKGKTWSTAQVAPFDYKTGTFMRLAWSPKGGESGTLHLTYSGTDSPTVAGSGDVYYKRSTDGGRTWTEARNVTDDDPRALVGQYYPNLSIAPNGRVDLAFYDIRDDPGYRSNDVYYTYSEDNGVSWSKNLRVTEQSIDRRMGVWSLNYDMTTPPAVASTNAYAVFAWDDTRNSDPTVADNATLGGGLQDIYVANAQFTAIGGGASKAAKVILAGVVGLVAVGLVLLLVAMATRSRSGAAPPRTARSAERPPAQVR